MIRDNNAKVFWAKNKIFAKLGASDIAEANLLESAWDQILEAHNMSVPFDIVLCDWSMPWGNGNELLERIRSHKEDEIRLMKFVMVTGAYENTIKTIMTKFELLFGLMEAASPH